MSRILLALSLLGTVGIDAVALGWSEPNMIYSRSVTQFVAQPIREQQVRLSGYLVHGSLCRVEQPCEYRFRISDRDGTPELPVRYARCLVPDSFGEIPGMDVALTVEGELYDHRRDFEASGIFVKCSGKYEPNRPRVRVAPTPTCAP